MFHLFRMTSSNEVEVKHSSDTDGLKGYLHVEHNWDTFKVRISEYKKKTEVEREKKRKPCKNIYPQFFPFCNSYDKECGK